MNKLGVGIYLLTGVLAVGCLVYAVVMHIYTSSHTASFYRQAFLEQDPTLSFPYEDSQVDDNLLLGLSIGVVQVGMLVSIVGYGLYVKATEHRRQKVLHYAILIYLGFILAWTLTYGITNSLKVLFGAPRPSFFALCDYAGYRDALKTGNFTDYWAATQFGRRGDVVKCRVPQDEINDAFMSFPSGHSSLMFVSTVYVTGTLLSLRRVGYVFYLFSILLSGSLFTLSMWVVVTRVVDYKHRTSDVFGGLFLGSVVGVLCFLFLSDLLRKNHFLYKNTEGDDDECEWMLSENTTART